MKSGLTDNALVSVAFAESRLYKDLGQVVSQSAFLVVLFST